MPRVSVVVPVFDVEPFLDACLASIRDQTLRDLEVVMVDDGSRDGSPAIARRFAEADPRFRLLEQPNAGLGAARNTGLAAASGEFVAFVDSDDVLPLDAYERLLGSLDATGSDFATGNVLRITRDGTPQATFLAEAFAADRPRTHVSRFPALLADRTAWNKLFRRAFWDAHAGRFPEGVLHEDIPVILPAHFAASSVDVLSAPVYLWRQREGGVTSITQRRLDLGVLRDRFAALEHVRDRLEQEGPPGAVGWYQRHVAADDLRLYLDLLHEAGDEYRAEFVRRANALLAGSGPEVYAHLPAIDRLKWDLVRQERPDELVELLRRHRAAAGRVPLAVKRRIPAGLRRRLALTLARRG